MSRSFRLLVISALLVGAAFVVSRSFQIGSLDPFTTTKVQAGINAQIQLYDNGSLITNPRGGATGNDLSKVQTSLGLTTTGFNVEVTGAASVADDFVVPAGGWTIQTVTVYAYQTGSTQASTIDDIRVRIWNGLPGGVGSTVVFGDLTTNRLSTTSFSNIFRAVEATPTDTTRPVMANIANLGVTLPAGTYWIEFKVGGTGASNPSIPPVSVLGLTAKPGANGLQGISGTYNPLNDSGSGARQDIPFLLTANACASFSNSAAIAIPALGNGNPYPSTINVAGLSGTVTNVTVTLADMNHTFSDDLDILLASPDGRNVMLMSDVGGTNGLIHNTFTFSDSGAVGMSDALINPNGTYKPTNFDSDVTLPAPAPTPPYNTTMATFNGASPNGAWKLYVVDDGPNDSGNINGGWTITISTTTCPGAPTPTPTATPCGVRTILVTPASGAIPDNNPAGVSIPFAVNNANTITDVNFSFLGTISSSDPLSTTVGVNHSFISDLIFTLTSPAGTSVVIYDRPRNPGVGCPSNNLYQLLLDDDGGFPSVEAQCPGGDGDGPLTGNFAPNNPLSAFDGQNPNGIWTLKAVDAALQDTGTVRAFVLSLTGACTTPTPTATPTATPTPTPTATPTPSGRTSFDYDGDHKSDISVFRPSTGAWYLQQSTAGTFGISFGIATDRIAPADYDGDGKTDIAVYRPSTGIWYITNSSNGSVTYYVFGLAEDLPTPADYDLDGKADVSVFRPSSGTWYRLNSSNGAFVAYQFGANGDRPTIGDFDGDGKADYAVFRPSIGAWYQVKSSNGTTFGEQFGIGTDKITPADYDGDGKTDIAIYRPSESLWYVKRSATSTYVPFVFGLSTDLPAASDYDGDGKADIGVFRPSDGTWYIVNSTNGSFTIYQFGASGDRPTQGAFNN